MKEFVEYIISQGQDEAAKLAYAKLPPQVKQEDQSMLAQIATNQGTRGAH